MTVKPRAFEHWDVATGRWTVEPGTFQLRAGRSSALLRLATEIRISGPVG
jgi:beta-glucosidase